MCYGFSLLITDVENRKLCCSSGLTYGELWNHTIPFKSSGPPLQMQLFIEHLLNLWGTCANLLGTRVLGLGHSLWLTVHLQLFLHQVECSVFFYQSLVASSPPAFAVLRLSFFTSNLPIQIRQVQRLLLKVLSCGSASVKPGSVTLAFGYGCSQHRLMYEVRNSCVSSGRGFAALTFIFKEKIFLLYFQRQAFPKLWTQELAKY